MAHTTHGRVIWRPTRFAIFSRDDWRCVACRKRGDWKPGRPNNLQLDHVVPGRGSDPANLITLCPSCNGTKQDTPLALWRPDLVDVVAIQLATPIDKKLGRAFAEVMCPGWMAQQRLRKTKAYRQEVAAASGAPF